MILTPVIVAIPQDTPPRSPRRVEQQRMCARSALQHCAKQCHAPAHGWSKDVDEVPLPNAGFYWSVSHKRHWAAAVISDRPVGIDIEHIAPRQRELHDALADDDEWSVIGNRSWHAFFRLWAAKEATLKANGVGIAGLTCCRLVEVPDESRMTLDYLGRFWLVEQFYHAEHVTAVTSNSAKVNWCVV